MESKNLPNKRLFIGGLPYRYNEGELLSLFISEGKVVAVKIIHNKWGKSRGLGYVEYENLEDAVRAKQKFHNFKIAQDRTIIVDYAKPDPFLTEEGQLRHDEAMEKRPNRYKFPIPPKVKNEKESSKPFKSASKFVQKSGFKPKTDSKEKSGFVPKSYEHLRPSVFKSRNFGSRIGAKFARKNKRK